MSNLLKKEIKLSTLLLTWLFLGFSVMTLVPGYPILCAVFFITLGILYSFQNAREANDIVYSALLPVTKHDVVKGKYQLVMLIELLGFALMALFTILRMTLLSDVLVYRQNAMMNANPFSLGMALVIFGLFNVVFVGGFFKTAYKIGKPFVVYCVIAFTIMSISEIIHHFPGLEAVNAFGFEHATLQLSLLLCGAILYTVMTYLSYKKACRDFDKIDL